MSIYKGNSLIAGGSQVLPLLTFIWSDCIKNHPSWLRADTFSWQSGAVYQAVYAHLTADITGKTLQSETISGTTIQFYLADDGHKICPASEESNVAAIYAATGVAWYYIIDTTNQRFKLPRVSPVKEMLVASTSAPVVTNGVQPIFTDGSQNGSLRQAMKNLSGYTHYMYADGVSVGEWGSTALKFGSQTGLKVDLSQTTSTSYFKGNKYLYFYVGQFTQTALENTAGVTTEVLNSKLDTDLGNATSIAKSTIISLLTPDYENAVQYTNNAPATYTTTEPCWICCKGANLAYNMTIGNTTIAEFLYSANYTSSWVFCPAGCTLTRIASSQYNNFIVVPLKG